MDSVRKEIDTMNKDQLGGKRRQLRGAVKKQWGKLTNNKGNQQAGNTDQVVGKIQEKYGDVREGIDRHLNAVNKSVASKTRSR
jgi:uncharacterized protein YjbJ (UPF0337 family)